jgi:hypothetical protein
MSSRRLAEFRSALATDHELLTVEPDAFERGLE